MSSIPIPFASAGPGTAQAGPQLYAGNTNQSGVPVPMGTSQRGQQGGFSAGGPGMPAQPPSMPSATPIGQPTVTPFPGGVAPVPGQPGQQQPGLNMFAGLTQRQQDRLLGEQQNYYGEGVGALLTDYLKTGAGYSGPLAQQAIEATNTAMQKQIQTQFGDLMSNLSTMGISPDSSTMSLASSNFLSNASAQENAVAAQQYTQMYAQSQQNYLTAMMGIAGVNQQGTANQRTGLGYLGSFLQGGVSGLVGYSSGAAGTAGAVPTPSGGSMISQLATALL